MSGKKKAVELRNMARDIQGIVRNNVSRAIKKYKTLCNSYYDHTYRDDSACEAAKFGKKIIAKNIPTKSPTYKNQILKIDVDFLYDFECDSLHHNLLMLHNHFNYIGVPTIKSLTEHLAIINNNYNDLQLKITQRTAYLYATGGPYICEGVDFGKFIIRIDLRKFGIPDPNFGVMVEPITPKLSDRGNPHPHVSERSGRDWGYNVCLGDGTIPFVQANSESRLSDCFDITGFILCNYCSEDAYEGIEEWMENESWVCDDCYNKFYEELRCNRCDSIICNDCLKNGICGYCRNEERGL